MLPVAFRSQVDYHAMEYRDHFGSFPDCHLNRAIGFWGVGYGQSDSELPKVKSLAYWDAHELQDWGLGWHRNEGIELTFLESGSLDFGIIAKS